MGEKQQISFKVDSDVLSEFDNVLHKYHEATGIKPVKQESFEAAFKDYIQKLKKQIELLKSA
ncbi:MAG: hypothetical protein PF489_09790 [Salinivirgaceae bacterium]|jgi:hypothetical protein|nr:hypothetical protein [Salinivirgaceae bacterium]